jgi:hypothetical protein
MSITVNWPRFLIVTIVGAVIMLALYGAWSGVVAGMDLSPGYPSRPQGEMKPLVPFLAIVSITQLVVFCYLYLRVYPQRSLSNAVKWGIWGGFFMVLPDGQFFVGTPNENWSTLLMGWADGIVTAVLMTVFFQLVYRPRDESWTLPKIDVSRFLMFGALGAILIFVLDLPFHAVVAPKIFTEYPAHDFPQRPMAEAQALLPWLFLVYLVQLTILCYVYLRACPGRGMTSALWFGAWIGLWIAIPNMQFFVGLDKYTWHMLAIQIPEGMILPMILLAFFEWAYRPKTGGISHAAAA